MRRWVICGLLLAGPAMAEEAVVKALAGLPEAQVTRLRADPDRFAEGALRLVYGYGQGGAVTRAAAEAAGQLAAAERRAQAMRAFVESDLDNDGAVTRAEAEMRAAALGAEGRARLLVAFGAADRDADGTVTGAELRGMAAEVAARRSGLPLATLFAFDTDGDGSLTVDEIEAARLALAGE